MFARYTVQSRIEVSVNIIRNLKKSNCSIEKAQFKLKLAKFKLLIFLEIRVSPGKSSL